MRRALQRVAVTTAVVFGLSVAVPAAAVPEDGDFPVSWLWSWTAQSPAYSAARALVGLPVQRLGAAPLDAKPAPASATDARRGAGRAPTPAPDTLAPYRPYEPSAPKTVTGDADPGFDADTSKRIAAESSARTDVYRNDDGSITRRTYSSPTNYRAADGTFKPIDPDLVKRADGRLHMKANSLQVSVADEAPQQPAADEAPATPQPSSTGPTPSPGPSGPASSGPDEATAAPSGPTAPMTDAPTTDAPKADEPAEDLARVTLPGGESVGYLLEGAAPAAAIVDEGKATYPRILPQTDLELETFDAGLKETLVLRSPDAPSSWVFPLRLNGLTPRQAASGEIELLDADGKVAVRFPKGYMVDSHVDPASGAPAQSAKVDYQLIESDGAPALRVTADEAWLRDPARVYPVRVDPTATTGTTGDVYVDNDADTADQNGDNLPVGTYDGKTKARSFIHVDDFDDSVVKGKKVTAAKLKLYLTWAFSCDTHRPFSVHRITEKWTVADLTKGAYPGPDISGAIGSLDVADTKPACTNDDADRAVGKWVTVTLNPATFSDWSSGGANEGLALTAGETDKNAWKRFTSANFSSGKYKPVLDLTYVDNVLPQVDVRYPANNAVMPTLNPELLVKGHDADNYPGKGLKYTFVVYDSAGKVVVNSGALASTTWKVPTGKLAWNTSYLWQVQPNDKVANGPAASLFSFTTAAPQPALTGSLAQNSGKGYDASIGNYTTGATDASVATVGPSLAITRSYNSLDTRRNGAFGTGWASVLDMRVTEQVDPAGAVQTLLVTYPTGQELVFGRNADGTFTPPPGRYTTMKETTSGTTVTGYTMTDKDASIYWFTRAVAGRAYRLTSITDANARKLAVSYDAAGNPWKMTGASGRSLTITWSTPAGSSAPHVASVVTDPTDAAKPETATTWTYGYGPDDRLLTVCPPTQQATCWTYGYDTTSQYGNAVLNASPGSYWPLNDTSGVTARSAVLSNAGVDAARYTDVALGQPGGLAGSTATSAGFNGTSSHLQLPGDLIANGQYQSISMWFKTTTPNGVLFSYNATPIAKGTTTSDYTPALYIDKFGKLRGQLWTGNAKPMNSGVTVTDGAWHHVALAGEGDSQTLYVDGVARSTLAGTIAAFADVSTSNISVGVGFVGGGWPDHVNTGLSPAKTTWFKGNISDVGFFNDTLDAATVAAQRTSGITAHPVLNRVTRPSGGVTAAVGYDKRTGRVATVTDENNGTWTVGAPEIRGSSDVYAGSVLGAKPTDYWRLGEADATDAVNEVAGGTATFSDVTLGATGPFADAKAATFNGTSSYLTLPEEDVPTTGPNSIELWFKQPANSATGGVLFGYQSMTMDEVDAAGNWTPALYVGTDGKLRGGLWTGAATNTITSTAKVNDGRWHHVVLSAATTTQTLYLDGAVAGTRAATVAAFDAAYAYVGAGKWAGSWPGRSDVAGGFFNGTIAEVAYYNSALTAEQVAAHQAASKQTVPVAVTMVAGVAKAISMPVSKTAVTGPAGERVWYTYDLVNGNRMVAQTDALGNETKFGYDVGGYSNLVYDPRGVYTQELQDVRGNTKQTITCQDQSASRCSSVYYSYYPDATTTALTPDARNDLLLGMRDARSSSATDNTYLTSYAYDAKGNQTTVTDPLGRVTRTAYTDGSTAAVGGGTVPAGLPTTVTTPGGTSQTVRYFASGDVAELTDPVGKKVAFTYDGLGRLSTETEVTDSYPNGLVTTHAYDALGRETAVTEPAVTNRVTGAVHTSRTTSVYDADSNVLEVREEDLTGGDAPRVEKHSYNAFGQETTSTTEGGAVTTFTYDAYGRVVTEAGADGDVTRNAYDAEGNLLTTTAVGYTGDPDDPKPAKDVVVTAMSYDPAGQLAAEVDAMGWTTSYTYTDNGLEARTSRSDGTDTFVIEENSYDAAGNTVRTVSNNGATTVDMTYDAAGRMTSSTADPAGEKRTTTTTYDADDNIVVTTQRDGSNALVGRLEQLNNADGEVVAETTYPVDGFTPVGRWKLNETTGTRAADSVGNNPAVLGAGASWSTDRGGSLALTGSGGLDAAGPGVDTTRSFTVSAWAKLSKKDGNVAVVAQDGDDVSGFALGFNAAKDRWRFQLSAADDSAPYKGSEALGTASPALGTWTHLTGVYDDKAKTTSLYVDGKLQGSAAVDGTAPFSGSLTIGRGRWAGKDTDRWPGAIGDVQVYQQALTDAQVTGVNTGSLPAADAKVIRTLYRYDRDGQVVASTDANGNTSYYAYDESGQAVKATAPAATAETTAGAVTANAVEWTGYNTFGEPTDTKDANGNWSTTVYDAEGRPVVERSPKYTPPGASAAIEPEVVSSYDTSGRLSKVRDPLGRETSYVYDQLDRLSAVKTANGATTRFRYNLLGDLESTIDPTGAVSTSTWDYLGRQLTSTDVVRQTGSNYTTSYRYGFGGWESEQVSPGKVTNRTTYNALGEPISVTDGANNVTGYTYDGAGQVVKVTLPDKTSTKSVYDLAGRLTRTSSHAADGTELQAQSTGYDAEGNVVTTTDARKTVTKYAYDATGMLVRQVQPISASDSIETSFGYDQTGNRTRFTDGRGNAFWTTYNAWGLPESQVEPSTPSHSSAADRTFTVAYDAAGRGVKQFQPGGVTITSDFDEMGQLIRQRGDGAEAVTAAREFQYDVGGRLTRFSGVGGDNKLEYDDRDLPTSMSGPSGDARFAYNADGSLVSRTDAAGITTFGYDTAGRLATLANGSLKQDYTYNSLSQVTKTTFGTNGNNRTFSYDGLHRLTGDELKTPTGTSIAKVQYGWDAGDNLVGKRTTGFAGSADNTYTYDLADRLTSWNNGKAITAYAYDKSGNRVQNGDKLFTYDQRNRLQSAEGLAYQYTARGTLAQAGTEKTAADAFGQVITQQGDGGSFQKYDYDALGRAIKPNFAYSSTGNDLAADGTATYVRGTAGEVVGETVGGTSRYAWTDLHTDVIGQFAADGTTLTGSTTYDPLGKVVGSAGMIGNLGYQSEWMEQSTGRVNMHARWFNTDTGQFDTRDTVANSPVPDSVAANRYQYGGANPLTNIDPTGNSFLSSLKKGISRGVSAVSSGVSRATSYVSSSVSTAYNYSERYVTRTYQKVKTAAKKTYRSAKATVKKAVKKVKRVYQKAKKAVQKKYKQAKRYVKKKYKQAKKYVAKKVAKVKKAVKRVVKKVKQAGQKVKAAATRVVKKTVSSVKDAAAKTKKFVVEHKDAIIEVAAIGGAILAGIACTAATAGVGAVACMVGAGALINLAKDSAQGDIHSIGDALGSVGTGALSGLIGGAGGAVAAKIGTVVASKVGAGIGGRLVTDAAENGVDEVFNQVATTGRVDTRSAVLGIIPGLGLLNRKSKGGASAGLRDGTGVAGISVGGGRGGGTSCAHSFEPSTQVLMADGSQRPIADVNVGDSVMAMDPVTDTSSSREITALHRNLDRELSNVTVVNQDGEPSTLKTTQNHPFWSESDKEWTPAKDLKAGEKLKVNGDDTVVVVKVQSYFGAKEMRDLTVAEIHTYYVIAGQAPVLVHNCPGGFFGKLFSSKPSKLDLMDQDLRSKAVPTRLGDLSHVETPDYGTPAHKVTDARNMDDPDLLIAINNPSEKASTVRIYNGVVEEGNHRIREALNRMADPKNDFFREDTVVNVINVND